jgi:uncharacterized protein (UPF0335 family)
MAGSEIPDDQEAVANHTLAYLRSHGKKLDLVLETLSRHGERLGRLERDVGELRRDLGEVRRDVQEVGRDVGEVRRDVHEVKSDVVLMENKVLSAQTEILIILHRLNEASPSSGADDGPGPAN